MRRAALSPKTVALALAWLAAGCHSFTAPEPAPRTVIRPIQIDSVEVLLSSAPSAHVRGIIGDGCSTLAGIAQTRGGNQIDITIVAERPEDAICTQIAKIYDDVLRLPGEFPPGEYGLRVNSVEKRFSIP